MKKTRKRSVDQSLPIVQRGREGAERRGGDLKEQGPPRRGEEAGAGGTQGS
jgi:hypothetical protein